MLFVKTKSASTPSELTEKAAQEIYKRFEQGEDESVQFVKYNANPEHLDTVKIEFKRIESETLAIMREKAPDTQDELTKMIQSKLLYSAAVIDDVRRYSDGDPDKDPDYNTWKATFEVKEVV